MDIKDFIRTVPDFPKPGIMYRDITSLLEKPEGLKMAVDRIVGHFQHDNIRYVAGIEARGFIFGTAVAYELGAGFIPLRKPGKLPGKTVGRDYQLEYGEDRIEMHEGALTSGDRVLLVDDLIATGGTAEAALELVRSSGAVVHKSCFVINLPELGGVARLRELGCESFCLCQFEGH
jgi:adenine phosphoribosyltransferase